MTPNDNANASDNEVLGQVSFLPYGAGSIAAASAKIEAVAESGQSGSANPTSLRFYTKPSSAGPGNSGTERMRINQDGYVTIPNQPNFLTHTHSAALSANNYNYIVIANSYFNVGTCYNGSNGRFTAPIDGYYFFYGMYTGENSVSAPVLGFHKNGGSHQGEALNYGSTYDGTSMQQVKQLSAGDYVNWSCRDWNNQTPDPWHTWWGGYLLY